ncbi:hypothetical protein PGT21_028924 [Puccinia graminis f. sp. tritici]|nr:hypothetical protein PGT21_028924 [Puccinia graminis f. sp. tritici]
MIKELELLAERFPDYIYLRQPGLNHIEFKHKKADKGKLVQKLLASGRYSYGLAIGDKLIDEGMLGVMREANFGSVKVSSNGEEKTTAQYRLSDYNDVERMLTELVNIRAASSSRRR